MTVIEDYIAAAPQKTQPQLNQLYRLLKELLPTSEERIRYGMPTFYAGENILHFAAAKKHLGFYPTPGPIAAFQEELQAFKTSKGAVQLPYDQPLPEILLKNMVHYRLTELTEKGKP